MQIVITLKPEVQLQNFYLISSENSEPIESGYGLIEELERKIDEYVSTLKEQIKEIVVIGKEDFSKKIINNWTEKNSNLNKIKIRYI